MPDRFGEVKVLYRALLTRATSNHQIDDGSKRPDIILLSNSVLTQFWCKEYPINARLDRRLVCFSLEGQNHRHYVHYLHDNTLFLTAEATGDQDVLRGQEMQCNGSFVQSFDLGQQLHCYGADFTFAKSSPGLSKTVKVFAVLPWVLCCHVALTRRSQEQLIGHRTLDRLQLLKSLAQLTKVDTCVIRNLKAVQDQMLRWLSSC